MTLSALLTIIHGILHYLLGYLVFSDYGYEDFGV